MVETYYVSFMHTHIRSMWLIFTLVETILNHEKDKEQINMMVWY